MLDPGPPTFPPPGRWSFFVMAAGEGPEELDDDDETVLEEDPEELGVELLTPEFSGESLEETFCVTEGAGRCSPLVGSAEEDAEDVSGDELGAVCWGAR